MALTERTRPYETLIRHKEDSTIGAHHIQITEILRDAAIISATLGEAMPLAVAEGQNGLKLADVMGEAAATALTDAENLRGQVATLTSERDTLSQQVNDHAGLLTQLQALQANYDASQQTATQALADLKTEQAKTSSLQAQVALLQQQLNAVLGLSQATLSA